MDNPGWSAQRRAQKASSSLLGGSPQSLIPLANPQESARYDQPRRGTDGRYEPVEEIAPMNDNFVGGFDSRLPPPTPPPKDYVHQYMQAQTNGKNQQGYQRPVPSQISTKTSASTTSGYTQMSAIERSQAFRVARMNPNLQFMVGPLLRYDTVDELGVWHGFALVVSE